MLYIYIILYSYYSNLSINFNIYIFITILIYILKLNNYILYKNIYNISIIPARSGAEITLGMYYKTFLYRICMCRAPGRPVRALCEIVPVLLFKNMTCARPRCNAIPCEDFPYPALLTSLTLHLNSSHLNSSHLISYLFINQLSSSWLFLFYLNIIQPFLSHWN